MHTNFYMLGHGAKIYMVGYEAYRSGKRLVDCPYHSWDMKRWQEGWYFARDEARERCNADEAIKERLE